MARGDNNQVVYVAGDVPQLPLQLGQLLVDSSQVAPGSTNLQQCTSQSPLVYEPLQGGYPATPGEAGAGVVIVNYLYPPGHFARYGAVGDNATDDSVAVQSAWVSGSEVTGTFGNTYYCGTAQIDIPANTTATLYGVALRTAVNGTPFLNCTGDNVEVFGVEIYGRGAVESAATEILLRHCGANASSYLKGLLLRDCTFHDVGFYAVFGQFSSDVTILDCHFYSIVYAAVMGLSVSRWRVLGNRITDIVGVGSGEGYGVSFNRDGSSASVVTHPPCEDCAANDNIVQDIPTWEALDTHGGRRITFANNLIVSCLYGINASPIPAVPVVPEDITITGNVIVSGALSADPRRAIGSGGHDSSDKAKSVVVANNVVRGYGPNSNSDGAIMFQYTDGLVLSGNVVNDSRGSALCLLLDNDEFVVSGNACTGVRNGVANAASLNVRNTTQTGHVASNYFNGSAEYAAFIANDNAGVTFGPNRWVSSGTLFSGASFAGAGFMISGALTTDIGSISDGSQAAFTITVVGAEIGDTAELGSSVTLANLGQSAFVSAADTVTVVLQNSTGSPVDLPSATYTAYVTKR